MDEYDFEGWCKPVSIEMDEYDFEGDTNYPEHQFEGWRKPVSIEMEFVDVDPDVLGILTGGIMGEKPEPTFAIEVWTAIPWRWWQWQWWLRRPKRKQYTFIPNARLEVDTEIGTWVSRNQIEKESE